jgi:hypothetical protein
VVVYELLLLLKNFNVELASCAIELSSHAAQLLTEEAHLRGGKQREDGATH